jgi:LPXTG-site transpeptidase (sortase) family protein
MRNIGVIIILVLIGMLFWKAMDRSDPVQAARVQYSNTNKDSIAEDPPLPDYVPDPTKLFRDELINQEGSELPVQPVDLYSKKSGIGDKTINSKYRRNVKEPTQAAREFERIVIPSLKVNASVVSKPYSELTWDLTNLGQDVAALDDIPNQTSDNNIVFAGHVTVRNGSHGPFRYLWKINPGEEIILYDDNLIYTYVVREQVLVYPEESSVLNDTSQPQLTLITCTTWDEETLSYLRRIVVFADLEKVESRQVYYVD